VRRVSWVWLGVLVGLAGWGASLFAGRSDVTSTEALVSAVSSPATRVRDTARSDGAGLYRTHCAACHNEGGDGRPPAFPPLVGSSRTGEAEVLVRIVLDGLQGPMEAHGIRYDGLMPGFRDRLDDAEIAAVSTYVHGAFAAGREPVSASRVAEIRASERDRTTPWSEVDLQQATVK
jgi:mono/diheme cytochrome c family protein